MLRTFSVPTRYVHLKIRYITLVVIYSRSWHDLSMRSTLEHGFKPAASKLGVYKTPPWKHYSSPLVINSKGGWANVNDILYLILKRFLPLR